MADVATEALPPPPKAGPSLIIQIGALLVLTAVAGGMGWLSGGYLNSHSAPTADAKPAPAAGSHGSMTGGGHGEAAGGHGEAPAAGGHGEAAPANLVVDLPGIMTNLAAPSDTWLRMELSIVLDAPQATDLTGLIHQDILAYVRTLKLHQIEGSSGLIHLKADLDERAAIRSDGHVKRVLIRTMLFE